METHPTPKKAAKVHTNRPTSELARWTKEYRFSVESGDLIWINDHWYVSHSGLIRLAGRNRCAGIHVEAVAQFSDPASSRWAFKATVYKSPKCRGFVGYGDADPSNVSPLVHGAEMRVAETRAVNRALRKAYGIGICSVEEIGSFAEPAPSSREAKKLPPQTVNGKNGNYCGAQSSRPPLPADPPAPARCQPREVLRCRFLRYQNPPRGHPRTGRRFCGAPGRLGRERPQRPAVPAQQLSQKQGRCGMRRYFESLRPADCRPFIPFRTGSSWSE